MNRQSGRHMLSGGLLSCAVLIGLTSQSALAATLCVDAKDSNCYSSIGAAVSVANAGDTIEVAQGIYHEDIVIGKSLSLIGKNRANTIIDASGLANGIYIDGLDHAGLSHVTVSGFTIRNANFEGVLITNTSHVTLDDNRITGNDRGLVFTQAGPTCPGLPPFETAEGFDCGEAVHVTGLDHSMLSNNLIEDNAGGYLVSDETGPTHDNVITGNVVRNNVFDCGITIPTHPSAPQFQPRAPFGIHNNTITDNVVSGNGVLGEGAGIGLFGFLPGGRVSDNLIARNIITGNGLPGVAFHAHAPFQNFNNNVIVSNYISGNAGENPMDDSATPGPTGINSYGASPITGTVIEHNVIKKEAVDVFVHVGAIIPGPAVVAVHENNLNGGGIGVGNLGAGSVNATNNWWGCADGPGAPGCSTVDGPNVTASPWLSSPAVPNGSPNAQH